MLQHRAGILIVSLALGSSRIIAQNVTAGRLTFEKTCSKCHGSDGNGGELGPGILFRLTARDDQQLALLLRQGLPGRGMPAMRIAGAEMTPLIRFLRSVQRQPATRPVVRVTVETTDGRMLEGQVLNEGFDDLQLFADKRVHLLRRSGDRFREVTTQKDWPSYDGETLGNRYTTMAQIDKNNVGRLGPKWVFNVPNAGRLQVTPVVAEGIMYVTVANECYALDAGTGRQIWHYQRPRTLGMVVDGSNGINRGAAVAGDRVFMDTDNAHIIALDRFNGELLWETQIADTRMNNFTTSAPLAAGGLVISGVSGGEHGGNGFVAALDQATGKEAWRFWTVPKPGQPGSETWKGQDIEHGGAPTWFIGTYDPDLDIVYWPSGNPAEEYNGDQRAGDNLYSDCVLALDRKTGKLKWYHQFTPHDLWDWDSTETSMLIDADWQGQARKLMLHADRNGFFYVFDRATGELLLAQPFVRNLTWAKGIGADGRPILNPNQEPTEAGTHICPSQDGATNWFSPSYNPATGFYYLQTFEKCSVYTKRSGDKWESGKSYLGGTQHTSPDPKPQRVLKAIDIRTGKIAWELPQPGPAVSWGGTLSTATGLVIFGEENGALMAVDATGGKPLWRFETNTLWKASPMTYMFDGKQFVAAAAGANIIAFSVLD
ncbi:MAG: PQQ-binding-like beta-propeller repeat protein [Bryobacteraceae bacterium]|jgi:alcohol dehydrogenase (cytochrome c)